MNNFINVTLADLLEDPYNIPQDLYLDIHSPDGPEPFKPDHMVFVKGGKEVCFLNTSECERQAFWFDDTGTSVFSNWQLLRKGPIRLVVVPIFLVVGPSFLTPVLRDRQLIIHSDLEAAQQCRREVERASNPGTIVRIINLDDPTWVDPAELSE